MNLLYLNNKYSDRLFLTFIFCLPFIKYIIEYKFFNLRFIDDTQGSYSYFQYIYNYFGAYYQLPIWIDYLDGGLPSSLIIQLDKINDLYIYNFIIFKLYIFMFNNLKKIAS